MAYWTFYEFVSESGRGGFDEWIDDLPSKVQQKVRLAAFGRIRRLANSLKLDRPDTGQLEDGLWEIRLKVDNVHYRPICFYGPEQTEITILTGATEKDRTRRPPTADKVAKGRMDLVKRDRSYIREFRY